MARFRGCSLNEMKVVVSCRLLTSVEDPVFKEIKKLSGLSGIEVSELDVVFDGSKPSVLKAAVLLKERNLFIPDFSRFHVEGDSEGLNRVDVLREVREVVQGQFSKSLEAGKVCGRFGRQALRKATPKTTPLQVDKTVKELKECIVCAKKKKNLFSACSMITANTQREEAKYRENA